MWDFSDAFVTFDLIYFFWDGGGLLEGRIVIGADQPRIEIGVYS